MLTPDDESDDASASDSDKDGSDATKSSDANVRRKIAKQISDTLRETFLRMVIKLTIRP